MKTEPVTKSSDPIPVDAYCAKLKHPLVKVVAALRGVILKADTTIGEEIKWNAPAFFYSGPLPPSDPKKYARYLVVLNLYKRDCIRLVFWGAGKVRDPSGILEGDYPDGRRLASFASVAAVKSSRVALQAILKQQLKLVMKSKGASRG
jgi:hypothetical protein